MKYITSQASATLLFPFHIKGWCHMACQPVPVLTARFFTLAADGQGGPVENTREGKLEATNASSDRCCQSTSQASATLLFPFHIKGWCHMACQPVPVLTARFFTQPNHPFSAFVRPSASKYFQAVSGIPHE